MSSKLKGGTALKKKAKSKQHVQQQQQPTMPSLPSVSNDIIAELEGATLDEIVQRAQGVTSQMNMSALQKAPKLQHEHPSKRKAPSHTSESVRIRKDGSKVKSIVSKPVYKSSATSSSAREFLQNVESKRARKSA